MWCKHSYDAITEPSGERACTGAPTEDANCLHPPSPPKDWSVHTRVYVCKCVQGGVHVERKVRVCYC